MKRYYGGTEAKAGFYWNPKEWEVTVLSGKGGTLPGPADTRFYRVPMLGMLVLGPIMGAAFVLFLPFIGVAMLVYYGSRKVAERTGSFVRGAATAMAPAWRPGEAYLAGKSRKRHGARKPAEPTQEPTKDETTGELDSLKDEIEQRRRGE